MLGTGPEGPHAPVKNGSWPEKTDYCHVCLHSFSLESSSMEMFCSLCVCEESGSLTQNKCVLSQFGFLLRKYLGFCFVLFGFFAFQQFSPNLALIRITLKPYRFPCQSPSPRHTTRLSRQLRRQSPSIQTLMSLVHQEPSEIIYIETAFTC